MFYKLKPKVIFTNGTPMYPNDEYEQVKLSCPLRPDHFGDCEHCKLSCPLRPDHFGDCEKWNNGEGSQECCTCKFASWEEVKCQD